MTLRPRTVKATERESPVAWWLAAALAMWMLDGLVLGLGFVAAGLLLAVLVGLLPRYLLRRLTGVADRRTVQLGALCALIAVLIMLTINFNNRVAQQRAESLVSAITHYRAVAGRYPGRLEDLVPVYIDAVPRARYTLAFNNFSYRNAAGHAMLAYAVAPPFGRAVFDFRTRRWSEH